MNAHHLPHIDSGNTAMPTTFRYRPTLYFSAVFTTTTVLWVLAALIARSEGGRAIAVGLLLLGLMSPWLISMWLIRRSGDPVIQREHRQRLFDVQRIRPLALLAMCLLMPASVVLAITLSVPFGGSWEQLRLAEGFSFSIGAVPALLVLLLAAGFEELGWRGYAFDALQQRFHMTTATILFGVLWSLWHLPLVLVDGSYQQGLVAESPLYALNFFVGIVPMGVIISWVCLHHRKSILAAIVFHFVINLSQEALDITQATKCVQTLVLTGVAVVLLRRQRLCQPTTRPEAQVPAQTSFPWRNWYVFAILTVILVGQIIGIVGWARSWLAGTAPMDLVVGGLAMQGAWGVLLGWSLLQPVMRTAVLGASGVAMLLGNVLQVLAGHRDGSMGPAAVAGNLAIGLVAVGLVITAAWIAHRAVDSRRSLIGAGGA